MWWVGYDAGMLPALLAGAIPAIMVPLTIFPLASANRRSPACAGELEQIAHTDVLTGAAQPPRLLRACRNGCLRPRQRRITLSRR